MNHNFWSNQRVLITGSTGLLGSHLTRILVESGAEVVSLVRDGIPKSLFYDRSPQWQLDQKVTTVRGDLSSTDTLDRILNEYEIQSVFHLAAQTLVQTANRSPVETLKVNIEGTWNLLEAARRNSKKIERVLIASSDKAYGNLKGEAYDESFPLQGDHPYDVSKSCADLISKMYHTTYGLPVAITRCGNFFGPGDLNYSRIFPGTIRDILNNRSPLIRSDGSFIRDYIFVEDGAHAYLSLAEKMPAGGGPLSGEAFNFSYGLRLTVLDVVQTLLKAMGRTDLKPTLLNEARHEIPVQCLNSDKAKKLLQWKPKFGFDTGVQQTIQWYQNLLKPGSKGL